MSALDRLVPLFDAAGDLNIVGFAHGLAVGGVSPLRRPVMTLGHVAAAELLSALGLPGRQRRRGIAAAKCRLQNGDVIRVAQSPRGRAGKSFSLRCRLMRSAAA